MNDYALDVQMYFDEETSVKHAKEIFDSYVEKGTIEGNFEDDQWKLCMDTHSRGLRFHDIDVESAMELGLSSKELNIRLKCFCMEVLMGLYVDSSIEKWIRLLTTFFGQDDEFKEDVGFKKIVLDFLEYIGVPSEEAVEITSVLSKKTGKRGHRIMSNIMAYLIVADSIDDLYGGNISDENFIKYFPVYLWVTVSFKWPMRSTELMKTPYDCIDLEKLILRRTLNKDGSRTRTKTYSTEGDYMTYSHQCTQDILDAITKYKRLTEEHTPREYLLYSSNTQYKTFNNTRINKLIKKYIKYNIENNKKYDFSRSLMPDLSFDSITSGDSRVIALSNIYFSGFSAEICRQLAGHTSCIVSEGYFSNVQNTMFCSAVIKITNKLRDIEKNIEDAERMMELADSIDVEFTCLSPRRLADPSDIKDCIANKCLESCRKCRYRVQSKEAIEQYIKHEEMRLDKAVEKLGKTFKKSVLLKQELNRNTLNLQTAAARLEKSYDLDLERKAIEWLEKKHTTKTE